MVRIHVPQPIYDPLAQSVEHVTFNHGVTSSNLVRITIFYARMAEQVDAQDLKSCGLRDPCQFDSGSGHHFMSKKEKNVKKFKKLLKLD